MHGKTNDPVLSVTRDSGVTYLEPVKIMPFIVLNVESAISGGTIQNHLPNTTLL